MKKEEDRQDSDTDLNKNSPEKKGITLLKSLTTTIVAVTIIAIASGFIGQLVDPRYSTFLKVGVAATI